MRAEQGKAHLDGLTTPALARSVCFRQVLCLVCRPCRLQAVLNKVVRDPSPLQIQGARLFFGFRERDVSYRNVSINLVDDAARHPKIGGFRPLRQTLLGNVSWQEYRAQGLLS
jgi:hypothetical protein